MDEQSIWKKEISFRRKPKEDAPAEAEEKTSIWKKEISFGRKPKDEAPAPDSSEQVQGSDPETGPEETVWSKEVTLTPNADAPAPTDDSEQVEGTVPETGPEETVWSKEVTLTPKAEAPAPTDDSEQVQESDPEPRPEESVWSKEVTLTPKAEAPEPAAQELAEAPAADSSEEVQGSDPETGPEETVWSKEVSLTPKAPEPVAEESVAVDPAAAAPPTGEETWYSKPAGERSVAPPPVHVPAPATPPASPVVHPPVPEAELPPVADDEQKVPFWKKEISFGGKKREKKPKAERAPKEDKPKQPKEKKKPKVKADRGAKGSKRLVGLKIGASQLAAARVANNGSAELLQVAREPLPPGIVVGGELRDPEALAVALKDFFAKHSLPKRGIRLGIANNRIGVRTFEIVGIADEKQLANAIRFRAQEALPIPIDEAVLDYHVLGEGVDDEGQPTRRVLLVVAYRELIDRYIDACKKAGLALAGIDLEAFALLRALHAPQEGVGDDPSAALVAVAIGHERSTFAVSDGRNCEFTRVLEWGGAALNVAIARALDAAPSEVDHIKHELTLTDSTLPEGLTAEQATKAVEAMRRAVHTFARELVSSLQYYQNQPGSLGIGEVVLTGGTAHLPGLAGELESLIGVRVRVGDPLARMKVSKRVGDPEQIGSFAVAIGLGIED